MCQWIKQNERAWELLFCSCICVKKKKKQREMKKEVERMDARMVDERRKKKAKPKE